MNKNFLLVPCVALAALFATGCDDERYGYDDRPRYRSGSTGVDFYYTSGRPYSRSYGPLYQRSGRYYYSRGGSYVVYDRPTTVYRSQPRVTERDIYVRNRYDGDRRESYRGRNNYDNDRRESYRGRNNYDNDRRGSDRSRRRNDDDDRNDGTVRRTNVYRTNSDGRSSSSTTRVQVIR